MMSNTVSQLGPELIGFYGQPGIDANNNTTLFLVGKNFSVHDTQVIFGGRGAVIDKEKGVQVKLMSREVMMVTIPKGTMHCKNRKGKQVVHVHIATPYGVTPKIEIPLINSKVTAAAAAAAAVKKHVAQHHPLSFDWKKVPTNLAGVVKYDSLKVTAFDFKPPTAGTIVTVKRSGSVPFGQLKLTTDAELAFMVSVQPKLPLKKPIVFAIGTFDLTFNARGEAALKAFGVLTDNNPLPANRKTLKELILAKLKSKVPNNFDAESLVLDGYIRFKKTNLPIMRLQNRLTIKIDWVKK
ncbi:MAG: hypothetical protein IID45_15385 [Planctomycetes bacterium]|nr:hypothetical protein [Planctomycetota bacterium]